MSIPVEPGAVRHPSGTREPPRPWRRFAGRVGLCLLVALASCVARAGILDSVSDEVHDKPDVVGDAVNAVLSSIGDDTHDKPKKKHPKHDDKDDDTHFFFHYSESSDASDSSDGSLFAAYAIGYVVTSPFWGPVQATADDYGVERLFPSFPYDQSRGCLTDPLEPIGRRWSGQFTFAYGTDTVNLSQLGGRLVLETASRWGFDLQMQSLEERLRTGGHDQLWLGDGNLVFRFAQGDTIFWRTGLGLNWLDDTVGGEYGLNFTYGFDWFPASPWVLSATIDWGRLGKTDLFRFHTSAGVLVNRVETFIGYEYLDIGHTQINQLTAGLRVWF